ncbi:MAG: DNA polymerase/3'-5' exonuclease PolX [Nitriliruptorales bacterium]|nr:DNA polymerase/3'-5' exonuclease PolX [Nitriliruptorales bacterium]
MAWTNEDVAGRFSEIATLLKLKGEDAFRVRAYERAAAAIGAASVDLATVSPDQLSELKGIGASTAKKITEYLETGTIGMLEELRAGVPPGLVELVRIPGLGPKTAAILHAELGVDSVESLRHAIEAGQLRGLKGLGAKTEANLRDSIVRMGAKHDERVPAADAIAIAGELCTRLRALPGVDEVVYAGSLRRMRDTIGDVDLLAASSDPEPVMAALRDSDLVERVIAAGEKKTSVILRRGIQADLRVVDPVAWGAALVYFTGSKAHNIRIRERAIRRRLSLNEYGLWRIGEDGRDGLLGERVASRTESDVYAALGMQFVPPPMREDTGEVEAAAQGTLPQVVTVADIRGDLHGHSDWSGDGKATLEEMVHAAAERGLAYWAVTDHAENLSINGIDREGMRCRRRAIAELQERVGLRILDGVELNIGIDGSLDYDLEFLLEFDFCVASVHTLLNRPGEEQTARILAAIEHPAVNVIGHPTGRKIGRRPGYDIDLDALVERAVFTGTALELNASPRRFDLSAEHCRRAIEGGALLTISCDAHSVGDLDNLGYGVATAQRGWVPPDRVLNCWDLDRLLDMVNAKRGSRMRKVR